MNFSGGPLKVKVPVTWPWVPPWEPAAWLDVGKKPCSYHAGSLASDSREGNSPNPFGFEGSSCLEGFLHHMRSPIIEPFLSSNIQLSINFFNKLYISQSSSCPKRNLVAHFALLDACSGFAWLPTPQLTEDCRVVCFELVVVKPTETPLVSIGNRWPGTCWDFEVKQMTTI